MKVLVDTSVWSLAFRKKNISVQEQIIVNELKDLIRDLRVVLIGPVRQELLSGIADQQICEQLRSKLQPFSDLAITTDDYENAACYFNLCRSKGVQGSHIDYLLCAVAVKHNLLLFTLDQDFIRYSKHLPIKLYKLP